MVVLHLLLRDNKVKECLENEFIFVSTPYFYIVVLLFGYPCIIKPGSQSYNYIFLSNYSSTSSNVTKTNRLQTAKNRENRNQARKRKTRKRKKKMKEKTRVTRKRKTKRVRKRVLFYDEWKWAVLIFMLFYTATKGKIFRSSFPLTLEQCRMHVQNTVTLHTINNPNNINGTNRFGRANSTEVS